MKAFFVIAILSVISPIIGAQEVLLLNNIQNPMQFNAAATGLIYKHRISVSSEILHGFKDPHQIALQAMYEKGTAKLGYGGFVIYEQLGFYRNTAVGFQLSYPLFENNRFKLSLGTSILPRTSLLEIDRFGTWDYKNNIDDTLIPSQHRSQFSLGSNSGVWLLSNRLNVGISFFFNCKYGEIDLKNEYRGIGYLSYSFVKRNDIEVNPELFITTDGYSHYFYSGINARFYAKYKIGFGITSNEQYRARLGLEWHQFDFSIIHQTTIREQQMFVFRESCIHIAFNLN